MAVDSIRRTELNVTSALTELARIRAFVHEGYAVLPPGALSEEEMAQLDVAITEAASNIMRHGYKGRSDQPLHVRLDVEPTQLVICICHRGEPLDPQVLAHAELPDQPSEGGMGLWLIRSCTDEVRFHRDEQGRYCISLIKKLHGSG